MRQDLRIIAPPQSRDSNGLFKPVMNIAVTLTLAILIILGPSHISDGAPELAGTTAQAQSHHDGHTATSHNAEHAAGSQHHSNTVKVYCNSLTPGHASHAQHGDEMCEGNRVMASSLGATEIDMTRKFFLLDVEASAGILPTGHSPEHLKEPPRAA